MFIAIETTIQIVIILIATKKNQKKFTSPTRLCVLIMGQTERPKAPNFFFFFKPLYVAPSFLSFFKPLYV